MYNVKCLYDLNIENSVIIVLWTWFVQCDYDYFAQDVKKTSLYFIYNNMLTIL